MNDRTQLKFHHPRREYLRLNKWQILGNHASFTCCGTSIGKVRISVFGLWSTDIFGPRIAGMNVLVDMSKLDIRSWA